MEHGNGVPDTPLHTLIPLADFKAVLGLDDRENALSCYCLITATFTIEQYCKRRLIRLRRSGGHGVRGKSHPGRCCQPERSLLHGIVQRAGLGVTDIDCSTIPVTLTFARLKKNIWAELSELVTAYRCHLECAPEKPLVFAHSPYQAEPLHDDDYSYTFTGEHIFYLRKTARLKINLPVSLEKQEIWRYEEAPVLYDEFLQFHYRIIEPGGKERAVVYADNIDTQEEAESRLAYEGGPFAYSAYDVTTHHDRAILTVNKEADGDVYKAAIYGRPIVLDINRSCFLRNEESIAAYGTVALNVTGSYFSEHEIDGLYQEMGTVSKYIPELVYGKLEKPALAGLSCIVSDKLLYRFLGP